MYKGPQNTAGKTVLTSFLADVWENREWILYGPARPNLKGDTVTDRVYELYAGHPSNNTAPLSAPQQAYQLALRQHSGASAENPEWVFKHFSSAMPDIRIYFNPRPECAVELFASIAWVVNNPLKDAVITGHRPGTKVKQTLSSPAVPKGDLDANWRDYQCGIKVCNEREAFSGRSDKIVMYLAGGRKMAFSTLEGIREVIQPGQLKTDVPPMTERAYAGVSIGPQPSDGGSFGSLRSSLIAVALIQEVHGQASSLATEALAEEGYLNAPLPPIAKGQAIRSPNRLNFFQKAQSAFTSSNINKDAPWAALN